MRKVGKEVVTDYYCGSHFNRSGVEEASDVVVWLGVKVGSCSVVVLVNGYDGSAVEVILEGGEVTVVSR